MSDSEEEEQYPFLGTPLEPLEEGDIPKKKHMGVQDQIATDKYGRRRFHGAFTGGFSAGHFNSVGTPEGWRPTSFKSSRSTKVDSKFQKPEDFMDDEDMDDFGIAPSVVRAKSEYSGSKTTKKRERVNFQEGPIPGEPVLQKILEPSKDTVGVLLLMKMGWKPGQGIGPRISKMEKRLQKRKSKLEKGASGVGAKVYGCAMKPPSSSEESGSDDDLDSDTLFAPDDVDVTFNKPKTDVFGMGYSGLDRTSVLSIKQNDPSKALPDTFRLMDNNKKLAIRGQAFGVGAFEEEDADIYARDDMSQYDFALETPASLREKRKQERAAKEKLLAITGGEDVLEGFVAAKNPPSQKKFFPPPTLPPGYEPIHTARKSRFGPQRTNIPEVKGPKKALDAEDRSVILGEKPSSRKPFEKRTEEDKTDENNLPELPPGDPKDDHNFKPFIADPSKQARYEKYLQLVKIGAKDAFSSIQPKNMSEWEKERERTEFEQAAKLYRPLSGMMADRFARAELPDESLDPLAPVAKMVQGVSADMAAAAKSKMFGKLTRSVEDWAPVSLVCKRMNIAEPLNRGGKSLCEVAKDRTQPKSRFSVFDILVNSDDPFSRFNKTAVSDKGTSSSTAEVPPHQEDVQDKPVSGTEALKSSDPEELSDPFEKIKFDDPAEKKDLFKAIFCDSEDEDEEETPPPPKLAPPKPSEASQQNVLRNTSPPRGIFANLNLDKLNEKKSASDSKVEEASNDLGVTSKQDGVNDSGGAGSVPPNVGGQDGAEPPKQDIYGPALPNRPIFVHKHKVPPKPAVSSSDSSSSSSEEEQWVEKESSSSSKKKKKRKKKENKKEKKRRKSKKHKDHKRKHKDKRK
uniref:G-patch domain-containing protein n=1 Tax=Lygus hesperus TaxID=30085 RepID=A0A0A9YGP9_LYGHE